MYVANVELLDKLEIAPLSLVGRTALITGSGRGIGEATAVFANLDTKVGEPARLILTSRGRSTAHWLSRATLECLRFISEARYIPPPPQLSAEEASPPC